MKLQNAIRKIKKNLGVTMKQNPKNSSIYTGAINQYTITLIKNGYSEDVATISTDITGTKYPSDIFYRNINQLIKSF